MSLLQAVSELAALPEHQLDFREAVSRWEREEVEGS